MYYKSLIESLKEEDSENRIIINEEKNVGDTFFIDITLKPKNINVCPICKSNDIIKFGRKDRVIKDDYLSNRKNVIILHYNRLRCRSCLKMFNDTLPTFASKGTISPALRLNILEDLKDDVSFTYIANKRHVSIQTIIDIFESYVSFERQPFGHVLCMDEFKNLKHTKGKYAFVMFDPNSHTINDILEDRIQDTIDTYLFHIDWHEKDNVKYVITDMNESYRSIIKRHFKNATHIIDTFHFLRYVEDAFNNVRIRIQSKYKDSSPQYKILKKYWRILSSYSIDVEDKHLYNPIRKKYTSSQDILYDATGIDMELENAYSLVQGFLKSVRELKYEDASSWMDSWISSLKDSTSEEFNKLANMFINWKDEIIHSFIRFGDKRLHNGYIEGINNRIKEIKRVSFGYSNFSHFRNRIMYIINSDYIYKMVDKSSIFRKPRKKK